MRVHLISHTHWDREWYLTYEQFRLRLVALIDRLLDLLEQHADFKYFHLDGQTIVLEDYLEMRPSEEPRLRKLIADGRILIGPWYDMPDEFLVSGEALVRNLARGHRLAGTFGTPMPVGYLPDLFGHVGQMPQILRQFGLDNAILWRGFGGPKAEYWWQAPDGSRVLMMHLPPEGYCNATRVHLKHDAMVDRAATAVETEAARTAVGEILLMNGVDHVEPHPVIPELARQLSTRLNAPVLHSTLPAYVDAVRTAVGNASASSLEVIQGELRGGEDYANLLPGVFSARVYIKQANARVQTLLEKRAEPLATFASMLGARYPAEELGYAWKTLLQNHPHDSICGCSVDAVHEENMTRFARAEQVARTLVQESAATIARAVPVGPAGSVRLVAFNTTHQPLHGVVDATIDLPYESAEPRKPDEEALDAPVVFFPKTTTVTGVTAASGESLPFQVLGEEDVLTLVMMRHDTPWPLRARRLHLAYLDEVPPCGYSTVDVAFGEAVIERADSSGADGQSRSGAAKATPAAQDASTPLLKVSERTAENGNLRMVINDDGTLYIVDPRSGARFDRCGELEDVGDVGDEYNYSPPASDRRITSSAESDVRITRVHAGPLRATFRIDLVLRLPVSATADRTARTHENVVTPISMTVSLDALSPRVTWHVSVDNHSRDHRLRMLFPLGVKAITHVRAETAFGVVTRPARRDRPAHVRVEVPVSYGPTGSFTEAGDEKVGAIVFGEGLPEYEAYTEDAHGPRLALTLLRCVGYLSRDDLAMRPSGHAGPGLATPGAQCLGHHEFRLAFEPRGERPLASSLYARAASFVAPPLVVSRSGKAPRTSIEPRGSFLKLESTPQAAVLSACHQSQEGSGLVLRLFNPDSEPTQVHVSTTGAIQRASRVDFLERPQDELPVREHVVSATLGPHQIVTMQLE